MSIKWHNQNLKTPKITGSLRIGSTARNMIKWVYSNSPFFNGRVYYKQDEVKGILIFGKPTLTFAGKTVKPFNRSKNTFLFQIRVDDIPDGKYIFDEESNEDKIYIYYREQNQALLHKVKQAKSRKGISQKPKCDNA